MGKKISEGEEKDNRRKEDGGGIGENRKRSGVGRHKERWEEEERKRRAWSHNIWRGKEWKLIRGE